MITLEAFFETLLKTLELEEGVGIWSPLIWVSAIVVAFLIIYILRGFGNKEYKKKTGQTQVFLSGNPEYEKEQMHVKSSNIYWGFIETLKPVYGILQKMHTGNISDYVLWFVIVMAVLLVIVVVV